MPLARLQLYSLGVGFEDNGTIKLMLLKQAARRLAREFQILHERRRWMPRGVAIDLVYRVGIYIFEMDFGDRRFVRGDVVVAFIWDVAVASSSGSQVDTVGVQGRLH